MNVWNIVLVNRSNRPILNNEHISYVHDNVGVYQGKQKIINRVGGRVYVTNDRIIYIDQDVTKSLALALNHVSRVELVAGFLKSSPKVKVYINPEVLGPEVPEVPRTQVQVLDWVCRICSFNNHADDIDHVAPCVSCGVAPGKKVIDAARAAQSLAQQQTQELVQEHASPGPKGLPCRKCTFINHPWLKYCEMCGSDLSDIPQDLAQRISEDPARPQLDLQLLGPEIYSGPEKYVKFSFRAGGETEFATAVQDQLDRRRWEKAVDAGRVNLAGVKLNLDLGPDLGPDPHQDQDQTPAGLHKLELLQQHTTAHNQATLSSSLQDLEQLMYKAKDVVRLSRGLSSGTANGSNFSRTQTIPRLAPLTLAPKSPGYHQELARHLSEFVVAYKLTQTWAMITIHDLFTDYNRSLVMAQGFGSLLVTSTDFRKSVGLFDRLNLPIQSKHYESGLSIIKLRSGRDYGRVVIDFVCRGSGGSDGGGGASIRDISNHFGWSRTIAGEEVNKLVDDGDVVVDKTIAGEVYYDNVFNQI